MERQNERSEEMLGKRKRRAFEFESNWGALATYNTEVARGLVHTPEWKAKMAEKQREYAVWQKEYVGGGLA
jgi:hypothetical protein